LAKQFLAQKEDIDRPLAAILSLNTIAHTVGAAGVGAQVADIWGDAYLGLGSAILTILILIFTEIIPKTIGTQYWRKLGYTATFLIRCTSFAMYPFVIISSILTKKIAPDKEIE
jgi:CBS domain containing-hemolysin-like protein